MRRICLLILGISIFFLLFLPDVDAQTGIYPVPMLLEPTNGQKLEREAVTFRWTWEKKLAENEYFCVEVWESQMESTSAPLRLTRSTSLSVPAIDLLSGDYQWRVTVVRVADRLPEEELSESETWNFSWGQALIKERFTSFMVISIDGSLIVVIVLLLCQIVAERNNDISFKTALRLLLASPKELASAMHGNYTDRKWPGWEQSIKQAIRESRLEGRDLLGESSLSKIPKPFRRYALNRYYEDYGTEQGIERVDHGLKLRLADTSSVINPDSRNIS